MKLRKMVTVSAAALMLAGVGASATNAGAPVHASRRTVRISRLRGQSARLSRQIRSDKYQVKNINREIASLTRKSVRKGKRSKKSVRRHKRAKKTNQVSKTQKVVKYGKVNKRAGKLHMQKHGTVYTFNVNAKGQPITSTEKRLMSLKKYTKKYGATIQKQTSMFNQLLAAYQKNPKANAKYAMILMQLRSNVVHMMPYKNI